MIRADSMSTDVWASMCTPMHEIIPSSTPASRKPTGSLYLGSWMASVDSDLLANNSIRAIVEVHDSPWGMSPLPTPALSRDAHATISFETTRGGSGPTRYKVAIADSSEPDVLKPYLEDVVRHIRERLANGDNVLVHCQQVRLFF